MTLFEKLKSNKKIPMHMPGHKRNNRFRYLRGTAQLDITETDGFDNLHNPRGILLKSMENAAARRGADAGFYLVNGSTCGILASVCAVLSENDKVIMARNCHKSVYNGVELSGAKTVFVYPRHNAEYGISGSVNPVDVARKIEENPDAKLVIITSPTYEGVISDIKSICETAHKKNIPVMVDAAHGAHMGHFGFGKSATELGADISVESLHKTLPSLTQTAVCYIKGDRISKEKIAEKLAVFETSSPSYILLASIDACINEIYEREREIFGAWNKNLDYFYKTAKNLKNIEVISGGDGFFDFDRSKIVLFPKNQSGTQLAETMRKENIEPEMVTPHYVVCMTGAGDTKRNFKKLKSMLFTADKKSGKGVKPDFYADFSQEALLTIKDAKKKETEFCSVECAQGRISAGYVWAYPPGIPIILPGEKITDGFCRKYAEYEKSGTELCGNIENNKILVIK